MTEYTEHSYHVPHAKGIFGPAINQMDFVVVTAAVERAPDEVLLAAYNAVSEFPVRRFATREEAIRRTTMRLVHRGMTLKSRYHCDPTRHGKDWYVCRLTGFVDSPGRHVWGCATVARRSFRVGRNTVLTDRRWRRRVDESIVWGDVSHCRVEVLSDGVPVDDFYRPGHLVLWRVLATGVTLAECLVVAARLRAPRYCLDQDELIRLVLHAEEAGDVHLWTEDEVWWAERHGETVPGWLHPAR